MQLVTFEIGQTVLCQKVAPLPGNSIAPPLELNKEYPVLGITLDSKGNQHIDVGLVSRYNFITSFETREELPNGDAIHWCHPSRFILVEK